MSELSSKSKSSNEIQIPIDSITLEGNLTIPEEAKGIVVFAHGSGSGLLHRNFRRKASERCYSTC